MASEMNYEALLEQLFKFFESSGIDLSQLRGEPSFGNKMLSLAPVAFASLSQPKITGPNLPTPESVGKQFDAKKILGMAQLDRQTGSNTEAFAQEAYNSGLGPLAIMDLATTAKNKSAYARGELGQQYDASKEEFLNKYNVDYANIQSQIANMNKQNKWGNIMDIASLVGMGLYGATNPLGGLIGGLGNLFKKQMLGVGSKTNYGDLELG